MSFLLGHWSLLHFRREHLGVASGRRATATMRPMPCTASCRHVFLTSQRRSAGGKSSCWHQLAARRAAATRRQLPARHHGPCCSESIFKPAARFAASRYVESSRVFTLVSWRASMRMWPAAALSIMRALKPRRARLTRASACSFFMVGGMPYVAAAAWRVQKHNSIGRLRMTAIARCRAAPCHLPCVGRTRLFKI